MKRGRSGEGVGERKFPVSETTEERSDEGSETEGF